MQMRCAASRPEVDRNSGGRALIGVQDSENSCPPVNNASPEDTEEKQSELR